MSPLAAAAPPKPAGGAAAGRWLSEGGHWCLALSGDWRHAPRRGRWRRPAEPWPPLPSDLPAGSRVRVDTAALTAWDTELAVRLWELAGSLHRRDAQLDLDALPEGLRKVLVLAAAPRAEGGAAAAAGLDSAANAPRAPWPAVVTLTFFGEVILALGRWLTGRTAVRGADVLHQLDETGPRSLPIVALTCALIGLMLAYMGGAQLARIGAQRYLADVVTVGMVRELAGLMTGIILAGRVGSAFAAQLASMKAGEEIDALRVLGVDPIGHLVLPRLLALLLMAPGLIVIGAMAGIAAGWPPAVLVYGVSHVEYVQQSLESITFTHLWIGLFKGMLYVALVALAGCREGLHAGRSAQAVGVATTTAVVKGIVWIVAAACLTTVIFTFLDL